ncbi:MAG: terminase small subunit [Clostridiales bacterium]|nr:terminase small subunit [Clostridiales bacterium]
MQCIAITNKGTQCSRDAKENSQYCYQHQKQADMALNDREETFCYEYIKDNIGSQAAIRAGYSKKTATEQAARLLSKVKVKAFIDKLKRDRSQRTLIDADMIIKEIAKVAFVDVTDFIEQRGQLIRLKDLSELKDKTAAIKSIKMTEHGIEIKTHNKDRSLKELLDHVAIDKNEHERLQIEKERIKLERERIQLQRQQLELQESKAGFSDEDQEGTGVIIIPQATEGEE